MARKPEVEYIRYYTDGSAARQLEPKQPRRKRSGANRAQKQKKILVRVDPLAVAGLLLAAVMLVLMVVGAVDLYNAQREARQMQRYVHYLQQQNAALNATYATGYDLEKIEQAALALGMIPQSGAQSITILIPQDEIVEEPTIWEEITAFFQGLFA